MSNQTYNEQGGHNKPTKNNISIVIADAMDVITSDSIVATWNRIMTRNYAAELVREPQADQENNALHIPTALSIFEDIDINQNMPMTDISTMSSDDD